DAGAEVIRAEVSGDERLDLTATLRLIATRGITRLMVEGGPTVAAAFLAADMLDDVALFTSPKPLGEGIDALAGLPLTALTQSSRLKAIGRETVGADTLELFERA